MKRDYFTKSDAGQTYLLVIIVQLVSVILLSLIPGSIFQKNEALYFCYNMLFQSLFIEGAILVAVLFFNSKKKIDTFSGIEFKTKTDWVNLLICVLMSVLVLFLTYHFFNYIDDAFVSLGLHESKTGEPFNTWKSINTWPKFIGGVFVMALVPAFVEEVVFRGSLLHGLKQYTMIGAVLLSSVCFALFHTSVFQLFYQLYLAIIFALVVSFTQDIKLSMIMHFINNLLVLFFEFLNQRFGFTWFFFKTIPLWATIIMFVVCTALIVSLVYIIKRRNEKKIKKHVVVKVYYKENLIANLMLYGTMFVYLVVGITNGLVA